MSKLTLSNFFTWKQYKFLKEKMDKNPQILKKIKDYNKNNPYFSK